LSTIQEKTLSTVAANYVIWPAAHIVSFKYVPSHQRILYNNVIAIFWNCYLSIVASGGNMDIGALGGADGVSQSQLAGLHDIAMRVQSTLPYDGYWIRELLDLNNPIGNGAAQLAAKGASSPFIESVMVRSESAFQHANKAWQSAGSIHTAVSPFHIVVVSHRGYSASYHHISRCLSHHMACRRAHVVLAIDHQWQVD
jgi:Mpv17 / PMP22 family